MERTGYHIFVKAGDATAEVEGVLRQLGAGTAVSKGLHKLLYVTRADQTVVFLHDAGAEVARALRGRPGWREPGQSGSQSGDG
jgi:hypothetical protein